jgi:hypothetical protein
MRLKKRLPLTKPFARTGQSLLASTLGLLVFFGGAQAASALTVTGVKNTTPPPALTSTHIVGQCSGPQHLHQPKDALAK